MINFKEPYEILLDTILNQSILLSAQLADLVANMDDSLQSRNLHDSLIKNLKDRVDVAGALVHQMRNLE